MTGRIFAIKRFAVHDGDGIRTTVFFKGCPLKCVWCHNPEGISFSRQLAFYEHKCVGCGECEMCPEAAVSIANGRSLIDNEKCVSCGKCAETCLFSARELFGREVEVNSLADELCADRQFFESSGGGVTLSGGECLSQPDFAVALLKLLKEKGINTAVDTCGMVPVEVLESVSPYTDTFLFDIKAIDPDVHKKCTGRDNERILANFDHLCSKKCNIEVRIPYVVGCNDGEIEKIGKFLQGKPIRRVTVLKYHDLARSKYAALSIEDTMPQNLTDKESAQGAVDTLLSLGLPAIAGWED